MTPTRRRVVAGLDDSDLARSVALVARFMADLLDADATALHVTENGGRTARAAADAAGLAYEARDGDVIELLVDAAGAATVIVLGSTDRPRTGEALGHVARALMVRVPTPLVLVPPHATRPVDPPVVLVPLDGTPQSSPAFRQTCALVSETACELTALHVLDDERLPAFGDQFQYETEAWQQEFTRRHCDPQTPVHLELRVGRPAEQVLTVAAEHHAALIAVGWNQRLDPGRALTLRELLDRSNIPLLLFPAED